MIDEKAAKPYQGLAASSARITEYTMDTTIPFAKRNAVSEDSYRLSGCVRWGAGTWRNCFAGRLSVIWIDEMLGSDLLSDTPTRNPLTAPSCPGVKIRLGSKQ